MATIISGHPIYGYVDVIKRNDGTGLASSGFSDIFITVGDGLGRRGFKSFMKVAPGVIPCGEIAKRRRFLSLIFLALELRNRELLRVIRHRLGRFTLKAKGRVTD